MRVPLFQVDAFAERAFRGNPAAVCPLEAWLPDRLLAEIANENNLSETAFLVRRSQRRWQLRWFTPSVEVDLCGHATLAAAKVVLDEFHGGNAVDFDTRSGSLGVRRVDAEFFELDFPAEKATSIPVEPGLQAALGLLPREVFRGRAYDVCVFDSQADVASLVPDAGALLSTTPPTVLGVITTAPGDDPDVDFVSRFFAPRAGVLEDPVTGSAHCLLAPFWAERMGRKRLEALQISPRGGTLACTVRDDRVHIAGRAILVLRGTLLVPDDLAVSVGTLP